MNQKESGREARARCRKAGVKYVDPRGNDRAGARSDWWRGLRQVYLATAKYGLTWQDFRARVVEWLEKEP